MGTSVGQGRQGSSGEGAAACDDPDETFAQGGIDSVLIRLFDEKQAGFYVDVGETNPRGRVDCLRRQLGWSGISIYTSAEGRCTLVEPLPHDIDFGTATLAGSERPAEVNGSDRKLSGENWNGAHEYAEGAASSHAHAVLDGSVNGASSSPQSLYDILRGHLPPGRPIDLLNVDCGAASLAVLMSNDWRRFRSAILTVEDPGLTRMGASAIRTFAEGQGYELIGHLFGMSIYVLPSFLERTGGGNGRASSLREAIGDSAPAFPALSTIAKRHPGAVKAERHAIATAQLDHLRRQLDAARTELEAARAEQSVLRSSLAWRIAEPIYRIEARIAEWRSGLDQQGTEGEAPRKASRQFDLKAAKAAYDASPLATEPDSFVLYRIIGNDLKPRHRSGQSRDNVAFMLDREPKFPDCEKRWVVNRICDRDAEAAIIELLERHQQRYIRIPFDLDEYAAIELALEDFPEPGFFLGQQYSSLVDAAKLRARLHVRWRKNAYVMNNNGARNVALAEGRKIAKWVLPWDGNCFLTKEAWENIRAGVVARPYLPYFAVPMARLSDNDNSALMKNKPRGPATEEPQVIFRKDTREAFDERFVYGRRSKVELLARLGVSGHWDNWMTYDSWEPEPGPAAAEAGGVMKVGWVARLNSGMPELEAGTGSFQLRGKARSDAIIATLNALDERVILRRMHDDRLSYYDEDALDALAADRARSPLSEQLRRDADEALTRGPYSVTDKPAPARSGDLHDYWHVAPYFWPNPDTPDGLPFVRRDGERVPESVLYSAESDRFDRTRLQRMFDDTTVTALAWRVLGDGRYIEHAAKLIRCWFIDPDTRMNPHLRYAQVRRGHDDDVGNTNGVIEFKDVYFFLDAIRIATRAGALLESDVAALRSWMRTYLLWLETSPQGLRQDARPNNHGTMYDLQALALGVYVKQAPVVARALRHARQRMLAQFDADGAQPHELSRTNPRHYCCFNLQGWLAFARTAGMLCDDLWNYTASDGRGIRRGLDWVIRTLGSGSWPYPDIEAFEGDRLRPLVRDFERRYHPVAGQNDRYSGRPIYHPATGIAPYWMLARV